MERKWEHRAHFNESITVPGACNVQFISEKWVKLFKFKQKGRQI